MSFSNLNASFNTSTLFDQLLDGDGYGWKDQRKGRTNGNLTYIRVATPSFRTLVSQSPNRNLANWENQQKSSPVRRNRKNLPLILNKR